MGGAFQQRLGRKEEGAREGSSVGRIRLQAIIVAEVHVASIIMSGDRDRGAELPGVPCQSLVKSDEMMGGCSAWALSLGPSPGSPGLTQVLM